MNGRLSSHTTVRTVRYTAVPTLMTKVLQRFGSNQIQRREECVTYSSKPIVGHCSVDHWRLCHRPCTFASVCRCYCCPMRKATSAKILVPSPYSFPSVPYDTSDSPTEPAVNPFTKTFYVCERVIANPAHYKLPQLLLALLVAISPVSFREPSKLVYELFFAFRMQPRTYISFLVAIKSESQELDIRDMCDYRLFTIHL